MDLNFTKLENSKTILLTGIAGFIGYHLAVKLLKMNFNIVGLDNLNSYYDINLKYDRLRELGIDLNDDKHNYKHESTKYKKKLVFIKGDIQNKNLIESIFSEHKFHSICHLAAQAGVRYSIINPRAYLESNIVGTFELLEAARAYPPEHLLLASTSSAYGANTKMPYTEIDRADHQMSFYAATKKSTENIAHSYSHLFNLPTNFFTYHVKLEFFD